jgi:hypothetical protein
MAMWTEYECGATKGTQVVPSGAGRSQTSRTQHDELDAIVVYRARKKRKVAKGFTN